MHYTCSIGADESSVDRALTPSMEQPFTPPPPLARHTHSCTSNSSPAPTAPLLSNMSWLLLTFLLGLFAALTYSLPLPVIWFQASFVAFLMPILRFLYLELFAPLNEVHPAKLYGAGATQRKAGPTPPPYPNGWYCIMYAWELKKGDIKPVAFLGNELVAYRGSSGTAAVLDAYCPHLGAHLGVSGRIKGDCIECPFHGWRFSDNGQCVHVPGQTTIPVQAHTKCWRVMERNQMILLWYHVDGASPTWEPDVIPEVNAGVMRFDAKADFVVNAHIQEIPENTADVAHLNVLHHLPWNIPIVEDHFRVDWQGWWRPGKEEDGDPHVGHVPVTQGLYLFGKPIPFLNMTTEIDLIGPGLVLYIFYTPIGTMRLFETVVPAGPLKQHISLVLFSDPGTIRWLTKWFFRGIAKTLSQDCFIWNNKTYLNKPPIAKGDRYIPTFRRWYSQFFSENSISMQNASRSLSLDW